MKFSIVCIGKLKEQYLKDGVAEFVKRLRPYGGASITELGESKLNDKDLILKDEGERILRLVAPTSYMVLLDVYGKTMSSEELASHIAKLEVDGISDMIFVIGGAFGVSEDLRNRANVKLSFSPMTFTHQMVRLLLVEQLYRATKINRHEPYHW